MEDDYKFQIENQTKKISELIEENDIKMKQILISQHQISVCRKELMENIEIKA